MTARAILAALLLLLPLALVVAGVVAVRSANYGCVTAGGLTACVGQNDVMAWWN